MNLPNDKKFGLTTSEVAAEIAKGASPETFDPPLDPGIVPYVDALRAAGVETYESCQGGEGHAFPVPTVRFHGNNAAGLRALSAALDAGLPVSGLRRVWDVIQREATGPTWEMVFSYAATLVIPWPEKAPEKNETFVPKVTMAALRDEAAAPASSEWVDLDWLVNGIEGAVYDRQRKTGADFATSEARGAMVHAIAVALEAGLKERGATIKPAAPETVSVDEVFDRKGVGLYLADVVGLANGAIARGYGPHAELGERVLAAVRAWEARRSSAEAPPASDPGPAAPFTWTPLDGSVPNPRLAVSLRDALREIPAGAEVVESRVASGRETVRNLGVSEGETVLVLRLKNGAERALFVRKSGVIHVHDLPAPPAAKEPPVGVARDASVAVVLAEPFGYRNAFILGMFHIGTHFIEPGQRGMRKMEGHRYDVVLMEHGADPGLTGEALRRLRKGGFSCEVFFDANMGVGLAKRSATTSLLQAEREIASLTPSGKTVPRNQPIAFSVQPAGEALVVPKLERGEVHDPYTAIRVERVHQDRKHGGPEHDDGHTTGEFVQLIRTYCAKADEEMRLVPRAGERGRDLRHRLVQIAALAVAAIESIDRVIGAKVAHAPDLAGSWARLLGDADHAFSDLDGGDEDFIPKPQKLPERIRSFTKAVREAVGSEHPGVGWTLLDRFKAEDPAVGSACSFDAVPVRMPEQLRLQIRQAWDRAKKKLPRQKPFFAFWGDVTDLGLHVRSWASARTDAELPKDISTRAEGEDSRAVRIARPKEGEPAGSPSTSRPVVVVLLAEPLLGVREYIRNFFEPTARFVDPGSDLVSPPIDVLVVERGVRDEDIARAKVRPGGVVLPVDFARGTMTVTTDQPHPTVRETACAVLREAGYDVVPAIRWEDIRAWLIDAECEVVDPERPDGMVCVKRGTEFAVTIRPDNSEETLTLLARVLDYSVRELRAAIELRAKAVQRRAEMKASAPAKDAPPFKAHVPTRYTTWTAKTDMVVHWHPVHAGETVMVAERGDEVFVRIPRAAGGWLDPGKIPERVAAAIQEDLDRLGSAFVRLIKPDDGGEWIARRVDPAHVRRDGGKWVLAAPAPVHAATSIAPIYYVFRNNLTSTTAEAVTITTE